MDEETLIGFHGTKKDNIESICINNFDENDDILNRLFLGSGIYFFYEYEDAIDWNIKESKKNLNRLPDFLELKQRYGVIKSNIICDKNRILDLDNKEMFFKLEKLLEKYEGKLTTKEEYIKAKNKTSAIINMLYKRKLIERDVIIKTFIEKIDINKNLASLKNYPRKMFCVKSNILITNREEYNCLTEEMFNSIIYFSK